jgi:hypothetical protein
MGRQFLCSVSSVSSVSSFHSSGSADLQRISSFIRKGRRICDNSFIRLGRLLANKFAPLLRFRLFPISDQRSTINDQRSAINDQDLCLSFTQRETALCGRDLESRRMSQQQQQQLLTTTKLYRITQYFEVLRSNTVVVYTSYTFTATVLYRQQSGCRVASLTSITVLLTS